jgi:hypothetical protein
MLAIHDQFTQEMRDCLKTTCMGLGLVRLLLDAGLTEEARTTLYSLENGFQGVAEEIQDDSAFCQSPNSFFTALVATAGSNASVLASREEVGLPGVVLLAQPS